MKIKTGICSFGMSGKVFHAPFIAAHPGFELTAIVERSKQESKERYPEAIIYRSVSDLLADESIQLVVVNTPVQTHYEYAQAALLAGKHVVMEKPMVVAAHEAAELVQLAKEKNRLLSVYQNRRYDGDYAAVKAVIEKKLLGDIKEVEIKYDRYRPGFSGKEHKEANVPGAGVLYDLGAHLTDQALQLFGWPQALFADIWSQREGARSDDYFELLLFYPELRVRLKSSTMVREALPAYVLHGSKGSFIQQRSDLQEQQLIAGAIPSVESWCKSSPGTDGLLHTEINGEVIRKETHSSPGNYMGYYDDIYQCITAGKKNPVPGEDGEKIIRIIEAAFRSVKEKSIISL